MEHKKDDNWKLCDAIDHRSDLTYLNIHVGFFILFFLFDSHSVLHTPYTDDHKGKFQPH